MRKSKFSESQIVGILKDAESGMPPKIQPPYQSSSSDGFATPLSQPALWASEYRPDNAA